MIVEVRDHKQRIDSTYIEQIKTKRESVNANAAVIVSRSGFTKPAIEKAYHYNIRTMTFREALEDKWVGWLQTHEVIAINRSFKVVGINFLIKTPLDEESNRDFTMLSDAHGPVMFEVDGGKTQQEVVLIVGSAINKMPQIWDDLEPNAEEVERIIRINFKGAFKLIAGKSLIPIEGLEVKVLLQ